MVTILYLVVVLLDAVFGVTFLASGFFNRWNHKQDQITSIVLALSLLASAGLMFGGWEWFV